MKKAAEAALIEFDRKRRLLGRGCLFVGDVLRGLLGSERFDRSDLLGFELGLLGVKRVTLGVVQLAGAHAGILGNAGRLAAAVAQIIELGAPHLAAAHDLYAFDHRRINREDALDAFAIRNLADREILLEAGAGAGDDDAFIGLHAGTRSFGDAHVDADRVARLEFRELALFNDFRGLFGLELTDDVHRTNLFLFFRQPERPTVALQCLAPLGYAFRLERAQKAGAN